MNRNIPNRWSRLFPLLTGSALVLALVAGPARAGTTPAPPAPSPGRVPAADAPPSPPSPPDPAGAPYVFVDDETGDVDVRFLAPGLPRAFLGVSVIELTPELCRHFGVEAEGAVMVSRRVEDGPAAAAGVRVGDVLTAVDGKPVRGSWDLRRQIARREVDEVVLLDVVRDGGPITLQATLGEREAPGRIDLGELRGMLGEGLPRIDLPDSVFEPGRNVIVLGDEQRRAIEEALDGIREGRVLERLEEAEAAREKAYEERMRELEARHREMAERMRELEGRLREREREN